MFPAAGPRELTDRALPCPETSTHHPTRRYGGNGLGADRRPRAMPAPGVFGAPPISRTMRRIGRCEERCAGAEPAGRRPASRRGRLVTAARG